MQVLVNFPPTQYPQPAIHAVFTSTDIHSEIILCAALQRGTGGSINAKKLEKAIEESSVLVPSDHYLLQIAGRINQCKSRIAHLMERVLSSPHKVPREDIQELLRSADSEPMLTGDPDVAFIRRIEPRAFSRLELAYMNTTPSPSSTASSGSTTRPMPASAIKTPLCLQSATPKTSSKSPSTTPLSGCRKSDMSPSMKAVISPVAQRVLSQSKRVTSDSKSNQMHTPAEKTRSSVNTSANASADKENRYDGPFSVNLSPVSSVNTTNSLFVDVGPSRMLSKLLSTTKTVSHSPALASPIFSRETTEDSVQDTMSPIHFMFSPSYHAKDSDKDCQATHLMQQRATGLSPLFSASKASRVPFSVRSPLAQTPVTLHNVSSCSTSVDEMTPGSISVNRVVSRRRVKLVRPFNKGCGETTISADSLSFSGPQDPLRAVDSFVDESSLESDTGRDSTKRRDWRALFVVIAAAVRIFTITLL